MYEVTGKVAENGKVETFAITFPNYAEAYEYLTWCQAQKNRYVCEVSPIL
jgi:hypothetical protein